jgi:hypothetical protein
MVLRILVLGALLLAPLATAQQRSQSSTNWILPFKETALFFLPAKYVSEGDIKEMLWSQDGKFLLVNRTSRAITREVLEAQFNPAPQPTGIPKLEGEILVWNLASAKTWSIKKYDASTTQATAQWLGNSNTLTFCLSRQKEAVAQLFTSTADGTVRELPHFTQCAESSIHPLKNSADAVLAMRSIEGNYSVRRFNASLQFGPELCQPREAFVRFIHDRDEAVLSPLVPMDEQGKPQTKVASYRGVNVLTGKSRSLTIDQTEPPIASPDADTAPKIISREMSVNMTGGATRVVMMQSDKESVLISGDATLALANDQLTAVAFQTQGVILVRPIARVPLVLFDRAKEEAEKTLLMERAKEVAKGFAIYAQDHHDTMLGAGSNWKAEMQPYMKTASLLDDFVLAFPGGVISSLEKPSDTVLGYFYGKAGRVAAYVDGSVRWIPNGK